MSVYVRPLARCSEGRLRHGNSSSHAGENLSPQPCLDEFLANPLRRPEPSLAVRGPAWCRDERRPRPEEPLHPECVKTSSQSCNGYGDHRSPVGKKSILLDPVGPRPRCLGPLGLPTGRVSESGGELEFREQARWARHRSSRVTCRTKPRRPRGSKPAPRSEPSPVAIHRRPTRGRPA